MALKSDSAGFLLGEVVQSSHDLERGQEQLIAVQKDMRRDVRAIMRAFNVQVSRNTRESRPGARQAREASTPAGRSTRSPATRGASMNTVSSRAVSARSGKAHTVVVSPGGRDAKGRFIARGGSNSNSNNGGGGDGDGGGAPSPKEPRDPRAPNAVLSRLSSAINRLTPALHAADNADPTIVAVKELTDVVGPLGRGMFAIFGRSSEQKKERWYRRILSALTGKSADVVKRPAGGGFFGGLFGGGGGEGGGGLLSKLGGLLKGAAGGGLLWRLFGRGKGAAGAVEGAAAGEAGAAAGGLGRLGGLLKGGGKLLKRIPLLSALISGGLTLGSAFGMNDDPSKSTEENRKARYHDTGQAAGMGIGGFVGGALGTLLDPFIGPAGTIGGAWIGSLIGEKVGGAVGDWTKQMIDAKVPEKIVAYVGGVWDSISTDLKSAWSDIATKASQWLTIATAALSMVGDTISAIAGAANKWIKDKTGIDVAGTAKSAWEATKAAAARAGHAVVGAGGAAVDFAKEHAGALVPETLKRAAASGERAVNRMTGVSNVLETGKNYNVVERPDGSVVKQEGSRNWRNNNPGNLEYNDFTKRRGAIGSDGRFAIFPDYQTGRAAQEALIFEGHGGKRLSTAGDYGAGLGYKDKTLMQAIAAYAPQEENNTKAYQAVALAAVGGVNKKMGDYTPDERAAIMNATEKQEGFKVGKTTVIKPAVAAGVPTVGVPGVTSVSANGGAAMPSVAVPSAVPARLPEAPDMPAVTPVAAGAGGKQQALTVNLPETIGQDVGDRNIAHIVTGGIGA